MTRSERIDFLIKSLSKPAVIPADCEGKWQLYRALVNLWEPKPVSDEFLGVQDELLQEMIASAGITDIDDLEPVRDNLYLWKDDITTLRTGAIVNAANSGMIVIMSLINVRANDKRMAAFCERHRKLIPDFVRGFRINFPRQK